MCVLHSSAKSAADPEVLIETNKLSANFPVIPQNCPIIMQTDTDCVRHLRRDARELREAICDGDDSVFLCLYHFLSLIHSDYLNNGMTIFCF